MCVYHNYGYSVQEFQQMFFRTRNFLADGLVTLHTARPRPGERVQTTLRQSIIIHYVYNTSAANVSRRNARITLRKLTARRLRLDAAETREPRAERAEVFTSLSAYSPHPHHHPVASPKHPALDPHFHPLCHRPRNDPRHLHSPRIPCVYVRIYARAVQAVAAARPYPFRGNTHVINGVCVRVRHVGLHILLDRTLTRPCKTVFRSFPLISTATIPIHARRRVYVGWCLSTGQQKPPLLREFQHVTFAQNEPNLSFSPLPSPIVPAQQSVAPSPSSL